MALSVAAGRNVTRYHYHSTYKSDSKLRVGLELVYGLVCWTMVGDEENGGIETRKDASVNHSKHKYLLPLHIGPASLKLNLHPSAAARPNQVET